MESVVAKPTQGSLIIRGVVNIILGLIAFTWPGLTLYILVLFFAINIIATGTMEVFRPMIEKNSKHAVLTVILGVIGIVLGFYLLARPVLTADILGILVAFWALLFGISDLVLGFGDSGIGGGYRLMFVLAGVISIIFGIYLLFYPVASLVTFIWAIGLYASITGVIYIIASFFLPISKASKK